MKAAGVVAAAAVQKRGAYGVDNRYILDSAARFPNSFFPVVVLEAQDAATPALVADLARKGLAGVRLTGVMGLDGGFPWLASDEAYRLWTVAAKAGLVLDLMPMPFGHPPEALPIYADLARRFPGVRIVIDHLNWPSARGEPDFGLDTATRALAAYPNIFFKFTTLNIDKLQDAGLSSAAFLAHAVETLGADRVLWGSDMGNSPGTYAELVGRGRAAAAYLQPATRRAVLHDTGRTLFTTRTAA
jgi:L-fuconolactonase